VQPYLQLRAQGSFTPHVLGEAAFYSASLSDFMVPLSSQVLFGQLMAQQYHGENALYLGVFALGLAILAVAVRNQMPRQRTDIVLLLSTTLCSVVLAMGVGLHWLSTDIHIG